MLERVEPHGASMKTDEITPVSNRPHRDEDDGLTPKVKIAGLFKSNDFGTVSSHFAVAISFRCCSAMSCTRLVLRIERRKTFAMFSAIEDRA